MTKLTIKVTKDILEKSKYCGITGGRGISLGIGCAIALAVRDIFPRAYVSYQYIEPFPPFMQLLIHLPKEASFFMSRFDTTSVEGRMLLPEIQFDVEIPDSVIEQINIDEIKPLLVNHPNLILS